MSKRDLYFSKPWMNAAGTLGFSPDPRAPMAWEDFGAFVTNPISSRPRLPAAQPAASEYPGGFLLHTGLPNPGISAVIRAEAPRWARSDLPIIVHLMADRPEETARMVQRLERQENVMAVELGFAPLLSDDIIFVALEMCLGELPLVVSLPAEQAVRIGAKVMQAGAAAISMSAPRGAISPGPSPDGKGELLMGRLYGPSLFPQALEHIHTAARMGLPIIGAGGVWKREQAEAMISAGALAVQVDASLWLPKYKGPVR
jgi:dihydroorotate dehydrogenase (NAD+) catalytic subunit